MLLISICTAWVAGIFVGTYLHLHWLWMLSGILPIGLCFVFKTQRRNLLIVALAVVAFCGGSAYYPAWLPQDTINAAEYPQKQLALKGFISAVPEIKDTTTHLELTVQDINDQPATGRVLLFVPRYPEYRYGDLLLVKGRLSPAPQFAGFDYQAYLARQGIHATMLSPNIQVLQQRSGFSLLAWIYTFRQNLSDSLAAALPEPQAGLAQGILLGIRSSISPQLQNDLSITGTAHLIAISGINLTIIAGMIVALGIRFLGRRHYYYIWIALTIIWFYTILAGFQAPVIRSAIMASVFLLAELLGRQKLAIPALVLSAAIMVGLSPNVLWSVSFQLSFLAMTGLILIAPLFQDSARNFVSRHWGEDGWAARVLLPVTDSFSVSLGSVIAIWPIVAYNFGVVSFIGPLATFLIAPALTPIIMSSALTAFTGLVSAPVAQAIGWLSWLFLSYMHVMINMFASLPLIALQTGTVHLNWVKLYYVLLTLAFAIKSNTRKVLTVWSYLKNRLSSFPAVYFRTPKKYSMVPLLIMAFLTSSMTVTLPDSRLHVSFLDVGEGDAILIQAAGQTILVDGGDRPQAVIRQLSKKMPFWNRNIDLIVLTHPHQDHISGLVEVLKRYRVQQVMAPNVETENPLFLKWLSLIKSNDVKLTYAQRGQKMILKNEATIEILNPPQNNRSNQKEDFDRNGIVLKIQLGQHSFLLTADIDQETELGLLNARAEVRCTVLKVAHHGSGGSTSDDFLFAAQPQFVVISSGAGNPFGHPAPEVLHRLNNRTVYRTDVSGTIEFVTDGKKMWVKQSN